MSLIQDTPQPLHSQRRFCALGLIMISFLMVIAGVRNLDVIWHFADIQREAYEMSRLVICIILVVCTLITMSKGLLMETFLLLSTTISCLSFVVAYLFGFGLPVVEDPLLSIFLFALALMFYHRRDYFVGIATFIYASALLFSAFLTGTATSLIIGVGLLVGGFLYGTYGITMLLESETQKVRFKLGSFFMHINLRGTAVTPYERGVPMASLFCAMTMFAIAVIEAMTLMDYSTDEQLTLLTFISVMMAYGGYLCIRNVLAEGIFFLFVAIAGLALYLPALTPLDGLPTLINLALMFPIFTVIVMCVRNRDHILLLMCLLALSCGVTEFLDYKYPCDLSSMAKMATSAALGIVSFYHCLSRVFVIEFRREIIPLGTGNIVLQERDMYLGVEDKKEKKRAPASTVHLGYLIMAILLIWTGISYLNGVYEFIHLDHHGYIATKIVLAVMVLIFTAFSVSRGCVTDALVFLLTGLSCLDYAALNLMEHEGIASVDAIFGVFMTISAFFYLLRRSIYLSLATFLYAAAQMGQLIPGETGQLFIGFTHISSGILYAFAIICILIRGILGIYVEKYDAERDATGLGYSRNANDTVYTLGLLMLGIMVLIYAVIPFSTDLLNCTIIHATVILSIAFYAISKDVIAGGMMILLPTMVMLMALSSWVVFEQDTPRLFLILTLLDIIPVCMAFHAKKDRILEFVNILLLISMAIWIVFGDESTYLALVVTNAIITYYAIGNWMIIERGKSILPLMRSEGHA